MNKTVKRIVESHDSPTSVCSKACTCGEREGGREKKKTWCRNEIINQVKLGNKFKKNSGCECCVHNWVRHRKDC